MIKDQPALIIDVTYQCNASCAYCQWGVPGAPGREVEENLRVPGETLSALGIKRVVFSGGEPLLRQDLEDIASYYRQCGVESIIVITNGLRLFPARLNSLIESGVTGISASLDGVTPEVASGARGMTGWQHRKVMKNITSALTFRNSANRPLEFVVNTVVSRANLECCHMKDLVDFCNYHRVNWLKFTPVFDDGYLGQRAPWLNLSHQDAQSVMDAGNMIVSRAKIRTNPLRFWRTVAGVITGEHKLSGHSCGLDQGQALLAHGELKFCAWIKEPVYGCPSESLSVSQVSSAQSEFRRARSSCKTGTWCFCLQNIDHQWETA